jgi:hypothetical protein
MIKLSRYETMVRGLTTPRIKRGARTMVRYGEDRYKHWQDRRFWNSFEKRLNVLINELCYRGREI